MYQQRKAFFSELEETRESKVICYITGDRPGLETQIHTEVYDYFVNHLDIIGVVPKLSLVLYTRGGNTLAAWSLVNLIKQFCDDFEVIIPSKAHSAGTLMSLGAKRIVMTKQATLGPIDPSLTTPLNPEIPGAPIEARYPVSGEAINGFLELVKNEVGIKSAPELTNLLLKLSDVVHPLVLGQVYRSNSQIQMLARKLLSGQVSDNGKVDKIISFLCSESGSHDYTIHRREARNELGLNIESPDDDLYTKIKQLYDDIATEMNLGTRFDPGLELGTKTNVEYSHKRALIESCEGGSYQFITEGQLSKVTVGAKGQPKQTQIQNHQIFEGWRHEKS